MSTEELNNAQDPDANLGAVAEEDEEIKQAAAERSEFPVKETEADEEKKKHEHKSDGSCGCKH